MARPAGKKGAMGGEKPKNAMKTLGRVLSYLFRSKTSMIIVIALVVIAAVTETAGIYLLKPLINDLGDSALTAAEKLSKLGSTALLFAVVNVVSVGANIVFSRIMLAISTRTLYRVRTEMFTSMQRLPIRFFDTHTHGELMSRYTNDTDALRDFMSSTITSFISSIITIVSVFVMMLILSVPLTILVVVMLAVILFLVTFIGGRSGKYFAQQQKNIGKVNGYIEEMMDGQKVVKVFCHENTVKKDFDALNLELCDASTKAHTFANLLGPVMNNLGHIHYALTALIGAIIAISSGEALLTVGALAAFLTYTRNFTRPISQMSQQLNSILMALAGAERIFEIIDAEPEVDDGYVMLVNAEKNKKGELKETEKRTGLWAWKHPHGDGTVTYTELRGNVEFEDVTFGYVPEKTVLHDVSLFAKPGQKIAFVGSTGAGKTTITNLINRFYDVPDGKIRYDGININKIKKDDLRRSLAMVLQDTHLFTGTVMENIRYGKLDATDEDCIKAAKIANAHWFIEHLPDGYNTMLIADGANLSQGQRQLIAIARAAVADPPVLILDEATSSIDTRTERLIEKGMDALMEGRTVFVIAHRLSTVRNSDAIMVLEKGEIIERGNHDDLIAQQGKYYQLYNGMFELT